MSSPTSSRFAGLAARHDAARVLSASIKTRPRTRPREVLRGVDALLQAAALFDPELLTKEMMPSFEALARQEWRRPLQLWRGEGGYAGLAQHLLVTARYPMPGFLLRPLTAGGLYRWRRPGPHNIDLLAHLGRGGSAREAVACGLLPASMTRRMLHTLLTLDGELPLAAAAREAQVQVLGGQAWLAPALSLTRLGELGEPEEERARLELMRWLSIHSERIPRDRLGELVDWWTPMRPGQRRAALRLSLAEGLQAAHAWHQQPALRRYAYALQTVAGPLPPSGLKELRVEREDGVWELRELRQGEQLVAEGAALQHCVASYFTAVKRGVSVIFGLRRDGLRRLTVEVRPAQAAVVQARGLRNRAPLPHEREVLERWARENALAVRGC